MDIEGPVVAASTVCFSVPRGMLPKSISGTSIHQGLDQQAMQHEYGINSRSRCAQCQTLGESLNRCFDCSQWLCEMCMRPSDMCCLACEMIFGSSDLSHMAQPYSEGPVHDHISLGNNNFIQRSILIDTSTPFRTSTTQMDDSTAAVKNCDTADNCCASKLNEFVGTGLKEEGCERTRAALLSGTVPCKNLVTLMLSNLPTRTKVPDVIQILNEHGCCDNLMSFYAPTHSKKTSNGRGYMFVQFDCCEAALQCFDTLNGRYFGKRQCAVKLAYDQNLLGHQK